MNLHTYKMEYSLSTFTNKSNLGNLTLTETINKLNLVGFEVDEVSFEKTAVYSQDIKFLLKSPANRDDLYLENLWLSELGIIFLLEIYEIWNRLQNKYSFLLKQTYLRSHNYKVQAIKGECPHVLKYVIEINDFSNANSPLWIQKKLQERGIKPVNCFDDILELVALEWGYKFKKFDKKNHSETEYLKLERLDSNQLFANTDILLPQGTIILKNETDIKSILGLENDEKIESNSIYIEGTFYDIHQNPLELSANNTKLSFRNLRKNYLCNFKNAFQRLLSLMELLKIGTLGNVVHVFNQETSKMKEFKLLKLEKQLLTNVLNLEKVEGEFFNRSGLKVVSETNKNFYIQIPNFRNDLTRPIDLVEEYSRFIGYANFPEIFPEKKLTYSFNSQKNIEYIKTFFVNHNFNEVYTNPLQDNNSKSNVLKLFNPLNNELSTLRQEFLTNLIKIFESNLDSNIQNTNLFEIGRIFKVRNGKITEQEKLSGIFQYSDMNITNLDWFMKKGFFENFLSHFGYKNLRVEKGSIGNPLFHPNKSIRIKSDDKILGFFGEINPKLKSFKQLKSPVYLFEFNLIYFKEWRLKSPIPTYKEYSKYPVIQKDISIIISKTQNFYTLKETIEKELEELKTVRFFDIYSDEKLITSKIKLGIRLEFQSLKGTLTNEIIEEKMNSLRNLLVKDFNVLLQE